MFFGEIQYSVHNSILAVFLLMMKRGSSSNISMMSRLEFGHRSLAGWLTDAMGEIIEKECRFGEERECACVEDQ